MRRWFKPWLLVSMMFWISLWPSFAGCSKRPPEPIDLNDSLQCKADCVPVTIGFVVGRFAAEEKIVRLQADLKACQERGR